MSAPRWDYDLTEREAEVLQELVKGGTKAKIADTLCISQHTVVSHLRHIYDKLHVSNRTEAVVKAVRERLVD